MLADYLLRCLSPHSQNSLDPQTYARKPALDILVPIPPQRPVSVSTMLPSPMDGQPARESTRKPEDAATAPQPAPQPAGAGVDDGESQGDDNLDNYNPPVEISCLCSVPIFGFGWTNRKPENPRYQALAKFQRLTALHGIGDLNWPEYILAISVYAATVDRDAKNALRHQDVSIPPASRSPPEKPRSSSRALHQQFRSRLNFSRFRQPKRCPRSRPDYSSSSSSSSSRAASSSVPQQLPYSSSPSLLPRKDFSKGQCMTSSPAIGEVKGAPNSCSSNNISPNIRNRQDKDTELTQEKCQSHEHEACPGPKRDDSESSIEIQPTQHNNANHTSTSSRRQSLPAHILPIKLLSDSDAFTNPTRMNADHIRLLTHMLHHAESIYGLPLTVASAPCTSVTRLTDRAIVCQKTGIPDSDLIKTQFRAQVFFPSFYVAIDRKVHAIVVCIRGTANPIDSLTDVAATTDYLRVRRLSIADPAPVLALASSSSDMAQNENKHLQDGMYDYVEGFGHSGVLRSAHNVLAQIRDEVIQAARDNPEYVVLTTGHSLGAATAAALALLMRDDSECPHVMFVAFAPLPFLTYDLAQQTSRLGVTVVNGPDIVPRLSVSFMLPLFATARYVADLSTAKKILVGIGLGRCILDWDELERRKTELTDELKKLHDGKHLFIPGRVFQIVRRDDQSRWSTLLHMLLQRRQADVFCVSRSNFLKVRARQRRMFCAHAPACYRRTFTLALRGLDEKPTSVTDIASVMTRLAEGHDVHHVWAQLCTGDENAIFESESKRGKLVNHNSAPN